SSVTGETMKLLISAFALCFATFLSHTAHAQSCSGLLCTNVQVTKLYPQTQTTLVFVAIDPSLTTGLSCNLVNGYFTLPNSDPLFRETFQLLLAARIAQRPLQYLKLVGDSSNNCTIAYVVL